MDRGTLVRSFPAVASSIPYARLALDDVFPTRERDSDSLRLLVSELVTNAVRHSGMEGGRVVLGLTVDEGLAHVEVTDVGPGFEPSADPPGPESGWGLFLVQRLADRWGVVTSPDETRVWFDLSLRPAAGRSD
jgi:anti-sigma regulatory factor (Ser/Thr protein kinase)